jgi:hypothetical protein
MNISRRQLAKQLEVSPERVILIAQTLELYFPKEKLFTEDNLLTPFAQFQIKQYKYLSRNQYEQQHYLVIAQFLNNSKEFSSYKDFPAKPGIYAVLATIKGKQEFVYVGRSEMTKKRWRKHHKEKEIKLLEDLNVELSYRFLEIPGYLMNLAPFTLAEMEEKLILAATPRLNS